ncbi:MAG: Hsp20 family protein [Candidatus Omnitrophica bacterium]|nr:Hsp20 family protein [Candidatus Omnitrophota bacterium]
MLKVKIFLISFFAILISITVVYADDQKPSGNVKKADVQFADQEPLSQNPPMMDPLASQSGWDYDPFEEMRAIQQRMMRQMSDPWGQGTRPGGISRGMGPMGLGSQIRTDFEETPEEYIVTLDLPGYGKKDIQVSLNNNALVVQAELKGEQAQDQDQEGRRIISQERSRGMVKRIIRFPQPVKESGINAKFENGVLTVQVPKAEPEKSVKVEVV